MWTVLWNSNMPLLQWGVVILASIAAAVWDSARQRIPNKLTGALFLSGLAWSVWVGGFAGIGESLAACVILAFPYVLLFMLAGGGAGDAKMMGAIGVWLGMVNGLAALLGVAVAGIILGTIFMIRRRGFASVLPAFAAGFLEIIGRIFFGYRCGCEPNATGDCEPLAKMPYGLAILGGVCLAALGVGIWRQF